MVETGLPVPTHGTSEHVEVEGGEIHKRREREMDLEAHEFRTSL